MTRTSRLVEVDGDLGRAARPRPRPDERDDLLRQHDGEQPRLDGVAAEDVAEPGRDHRAEAVVEQRPDRVLARGPGAEVPARDEDRRPLVARLVQHERRVLAPGGEQPVVEPVRVTRLR